MKYPKVLIINQQSINKENATGITLRSILGSYPAESLMELYINESDSSINSIDLYKSINIVDMFPVARILLSGIGKAANSSMSSGVSTVLTQKRSAINLLKSWIRSLFITLYDRGPIIKKKRVIRTIEGFKPDVIYTLGASISAMKLACFLADRFQIKIVMHFMDDWPHFLQNEKYVFQKLHKIALRKWLKRCYSKSRVSLAISQQMANLYERESNVKHNVIMNAVNTNYWLCKPRNTQEELIFIYAGGLHLERWKALLTVANTIEEVARVKKIKAVLYIYTKETDIEIYRRYFDDSLAVLKPYIPRDELKNAYENADILVHTEVANESLLGYFRFSISTKIPEYLASNRPILFFGPEQMGLYSYLNNNNIGFTAKNEDNLLSVITEIMINKQMREKITENALDFACKFHQIENAQSVFYNTIIENID